MKRALIYLSLSSLTLFILGCGSDDNKIITRFTEENISNNLILKDNITNLQWSNSEGGCKPLKDADSEKEAIFIAKDFCDTLEFAGYNDWRVASSEETQVFMEKTYEENISLYYTNPKCPRLLSINSENNITSITTHNSLPAGRDVGFKLPAGIRCVR